MRVACLRNAFRAGDNGNGEKKIMDRIMFPKMARLHWVNFGIMLTILVLAWLAMPSTAASQVVPSFGPAISTYTNSSYNFPSTAAVGDFNGDGKLDVLIGDGSPYLRLLLGNGDGTFTEHDIYVPGANPGPIRAADLNHDGRLDAILVSNGGNQLVTVLMNTGNDANGVPQFAISTYNPGFGGLRSLTVGDLNGDGYPDFIVGGAYAQLRVFLNNGDGTFREGQYYTIEPNAGGPAVGPGVIADVNGDGKADFIVTSNQAQATDIFFGNGDGTLQNPVVLRGNPSGVAVADLNKDGLPDLVEGTFQGTVAVYLNQGNGTFSAPTFYSTSGGANPEYYVTSVAVTDINGDGNLDVVADNNYNYTTQDPGRSVAVLLGKGDGTFGAATLYQTDPGPITVAVGDFNGDGKPDIGTLCYSGRSYDVLLNTTVMGHLTVTANSVSTIYGAGLPTLTGSITGAANGDTFTESFSTPANISSPVGTYPITPSVTGADLANYTVTYVPGVLTVNPAPLTITADPLTKVLDAPNPALTASYSGFALGDGPAQLNGTLNCTTTATLNSPVGSYPITCTGQSSTNYSITYVQGTLQVVYLVGACPTQQGQDDQDHNHPLLSHSILSPIQADGSSQFDGRGDLPVRFRVCDVNGNSIGSNSVESDHDGGSAGSGDTASTVSPVVTAFVSLNGPQPTSRGRGDDQGWHFHGRDQNQSAALPNAHGFWQFNLNLRPLAAGTYNYLITLNDGTTIPFSFAIRSGDDDHSGHGH